MPTPTTASSEHGSALIKPKLTAEQALTRLLELVRTSKSIKDFTPNHLSNVIGVEFKNFSPGYSGIGEQITTDWSYGMEMKEQNSTGHPRFDFSFNSAPGTSPDMTDICEMAFDEFSEELESIGFTKTPNYVEHGRLMNFDFNRPDMRIEVYPEGEWVWTEEKGSGRTCVKMVLIS